MQSVVYVIHMSVPKEAQAVLDGVRVVRGVVDGCDSAGVADLAVPVLRSVHQSDINYSKMANVQRVFLELKEYISKNMV